MDAIKINSNKIHGQLSVFVFPDIAHPDKDVWIAYCPELDLTGYDRSKDAAKESLKYVLVDYFNYTLENGTLEKDLLSHGWHKYKNDIKAFDKARREYKEGKTISLKSIKDVKRLFRSL